MTNIKIFLDIDGVLNAHEWCHVGGLRINQGPLHNLSKILEAPCEIIIHSTWGCHIEEWGIKPFIWMLKTHGLECKIIDGFKGSHDKTERAQQIKNYIAAHNITEYVVIDDMDLDINNLIRPHPGIGLEPRHVTEFKEIIGKL